MLRSFDHVNPKTTGTIESFFNAMTDTKKIQCILDLPLAQISLPEPLKYVPHVSLYLQEFIDDTGISIMALPTAGIKQLTRSQSHPMFILKILQSRDGVSFTMPHI
jgi:hypothetical protein